MSRFDPAATDNEARRVFRFAGGVFAATPRTAFFLGALWQSLRDEVDVPELSVWAIDASPEQAEAIFSAAIDAAADASDAMPGVGITAAATLNPGGVL